MPVRVALQQKMRSATTQMRHAGSVAKATAAENAVSLQEVNKYELGRYAPCSYASCVLCTGRGMAKARPAGCRTGLRLP